MADNANVINAAVILVNDKLKFNGTAGDNAPVSIDYIPPLGDNDGYTSLQLLLLSLSSCIGSSVLTLLRKMRKSIPGFEIRAVGVRRETHPTCFKTISIEINLKSSDATEEELNKVIALSEDTYCPVWAMLKGNVEITIATQITR
jgi:putative redox protein